MKKILSSVLILMLVVLGLVGGDSNQVAASEVNEAVKGRITVLTNRTDIVDTDFQEYKREFNKIYPNVKVEFEAITDYSGQVKIRMNTKDYGDVLLIPNDIPVRDLPDFFLPLGTYVELNKKYLFTDDKAYNGISYGIPVAVNAQGILYNKKVFQEAGIQEIPKTPEDFLAAMKKIKENTEAIPYYTNYAGGWPMNQWESHRTSVAGDPDYVNGMIHDDEPFAAGKPHYIVYKLLYDLVKEGLIERDPMTTDWESSKHWIANGKVGAMVLGSWSIVQAQQMAANPADVGYMPFPYTNKDGNVYAASGGDYNIAINKHTKHKDAARAWMYWFINESGFAIDQGGIPSFIGGGFPTTLSAYQELGVKLIGNNPAPDDEQGILDAIDHESEIGFWQPDYKQRIIEAALGNRNESFDDIMNDLNRKWAKARAKILKK